MEREEIEGLVLRRETGAAREAILRYCGRYPDRALECSDWLRRLGDFRTALSLLDPETLSTAEPLRRLTAARMLNLLGASEFALSLVRDQASADRQQRRIIGNIFLSNLMFSEALEQFRRSIPSAEPWAREDRMAALGVADCLSSLGKTKQALEWAERAWDEGADPLLKGIVLQARGEYLAREGRYGSAWDALRRALDFFPAAEQTTDRGILHKWTGYVLCRLGRKREGSDSFRAALSILHRGGVRAQAWLHVYELMHQCGVLGRREISLLRSHPLASSPSGAIGSRSARVWISLGRSEMRISGKWALGLPLEMKLLALLTRSGEWGISLEALKSMLWAGELHAYLQLDGRIGSLVSRLRRAGHEVRREDGMLSLRARGVAVEWSPESLPRWIARSGSFTVSELRARYGLSKAQSSRYVQEWLNKGLISRSGRGRNSTYAPS